MFPATVVDSRYRKERNYDQLQCDTPLLETPPVDVQKNAFKVRVDIDYSTTRSLSAGFQLEKWIPIDVSFFDAQVCSPGQDELPNRLFGEERV